MSFSGFHKAPKVSCIVPCFNEDPVILEESLNSLVSQTYENFECIVIDESTKIETINVCKKFCEADARFLYVHPSSRVGLAASLNLGIRTAKGDLIARFDSDDVCYPDRLALQVRYLENHPEVHVVGGALDVINTSGQFIGHRDYPLNHSEIVKKFIYSNSMAHPTVMFRKSIESISGGIYDPSFRFAEDLELWLRLLRFDIRFANLPYSLVKYRQEYTNRTKENWKFNIKARIKNFSRPHSFEKIIGILGILAWANLPQSLQKFIFRSIQFRK
ncbi:glycosyltransferase [Polynucleobacter sp. MWH-Jannik1A5]|uniref:glycosyltransferase n=1 Tax=Polynucleobacter sp. MWH-Jannik1A5 TaxID=1855890 RepID=UPI001C0D8376|nr:glycosyltransferase [Polynucleobacter sp. MWH-Jannik1A5]MBU3546745.1 glycosyltransferase [Polynucleobacter sp. MWH-Jannik1A5]